MKDYNVKQIINNTSIPPTIYDKYIADEHAYLCIAEKDGKFGIVEEPSGNIHIPFEYDNISMAGFYMYLLVKNGKFGFCHLLSSDTEEIEFFELKVFVPCLYDLITFPMDGQSFVLLRKDSENTSETWVYYQHVGKIDGPYWRVNHSDHDYIFVEEHNGENTIEKVIDKENNLVFSCFHPNGMVIDAVETAYGTAFITDVPGEFNKTQIVLVKKHRKQKRFDFESLRGVFYWDLFNEATGDIKIVNCGEFVRPIISAGYFKEEERPFALGFVYEKNGQEVLLNGNLDVLRKMRKNEMEMYLRLDEMMVERNLR